MVHARSAVTLFSLGLIVSALIGACSSGEFSEGGGAGSGSGATSGTGGTAGGSAVKCTGPDECDDQDPCTLDECGADGSCLYRPKCGAEEKCCDGDCGQCCVQEDCNDNVACTADQCFNFFCAFVPDDGECGATQYCHRAENCMEREQCAGGTAAECDDGDPCTTDSCDAGLCYHEDCGGGLHCCANGCAACCDDSECPNVDESFCSKEVCVEGVCDTTPLCESGAGRCCEGADNASCGECCTQDDCDDGIACTTDACSGGVCSHTVTCQNNEVCDPQAGTCVAPPMCNGPADCISVEKCKVGECVDGHCEFHDLECDSNQVCCDGVCQQCCNDYQCGDVVSAPFAPEPIGDCQHNRCLEGVCTVSYDYCGGFNDVCCAPYGCFTGGCPL